MTLRAPPTALLDPTRMQTRRWSLAGYLVPALKGAALEVAGEYVPQRQLVGWATTWGKLNPDGSVSETTDRDGQVMDAAAEMGKIDWSAYLNGGFWNDLHRQRLPDGKPPPFPDYKRDIIVGRPQGLEWCPPGHPIAEAHRKVGWITWGHLWDRNDPDSWRLTGDYVPEPQDLDRADYYWKLVNDLDDSSYRLGFSLHGLMATSPCGKRITYALINALALAPLPQDPDATIEILKGQGDDPITVLGRAKVGTTEPPPCGRCSCPPGVCGLVLRKGVEGETGRPVPDTSGSSFSSGANPATPAPSMDTPDAFTSEAALIEAFARQYNVTHEVAQAFLLAYLATAGDSR